jgi:hypothetical protein
MLKSPDENERREALQLAEELQQKLSSLAEKAFAASGLTKEKVEQVLSNPANFNSTDWNAFKRIEQEVSDYQKHIGKTHH